MSQYMMTYEEAFTQALAFARAGSGPQAVLKLGGWYEEIHTNIPPATLMEWLMGAYEFWIVRPGPDGIVVTGPFTDAFAWIRGKPRVMGYEKWQ